jgi:hypothetical protein
MKHSPYFNSPVSSATPNIFRPSFGGIGIRFVSKLSFLKYIIPKGLYLFL